jgi:hypothetical protein
VGLEVEAKGILESDASPEEKRIAIARLIKRYNRTLRLLSALLKEYRTRIEALKKTATRADAEKIVEDLLDSAEFKLVTALVAALLLFAGNLRNDIYPRIAVPGYPDLIPPAESEELGLMRP